MFPNVVLSEWTKLRTTKTLWWIVGLFFLFSIGLAAIFGYAMKQESSSSDGGIGILSPSSALLGIELLGFMILLLQAIMMVTVEYSHKYVGVVYQAVPNRTLVALAKWLIIVVLSALLTFICVVASMYVAKWTAGSEIGGTLDVMSDESKRLMWVYPLKAVLLVTFAMGLAYIVRSTAGAISLMLLWFFALESLINMIPKFGSKIFRYAPFNNLNAFMSKTDIQDLQWGYHGSLYYFIAWAVGLLIIGIVLLNKRDV